MAEQEKKKQTKPAETEAEVDDVVVDAQPSETTEKFDDLLDEIDSVLEENAEEFVKNYVQKGGE